MSGEARAPQTRETATRSPTLSLPLERSETIKTAPAGLGGFCICGRSRVLPSIMHHVASPRWRVTSRAPLVLHYVLCAKWSYGASASLPKRIPPPPLPSPTLLCLTLPFCCCCISTKRKWLLMQRMLALHGKTFTFLLYIIGSTNPVGDVSPCYLAAAL